MYGTLMPAEYIPETDVFSNDKLMHFLAFGCFTGITWFFLHHKGLRGKKLYLSAFFIGVGTGLSIELLQALLPVNRAAEWFDFLADVAGSAVACLVLYIWNPVNKSE